MGINVGSFVIADSKANTVTTAIADDTKEIKKTQKKSTRSSRTSKKEQSVENSSKAPIKSSAYLSDMLTKDE